MSLRDKINQNPGVAGGVAAVIVILAIIVMILSFRSGKSSSVPPLRTKGYFTVDDGKTYYPDSLANIPPYQHDGKTAYRVQVFKTPNGSPFVGYLERYDTKEKALIQKAIDQGVAPAYVFNGHPVEVKKPGTGPGGKWLSEGKAPAAELAKVMHPVPPGGKPDDEILIVRPSAEEEQQK